MALSVLLYSFHYHCCLLYCQRVLEDVIAVLPIAIFGATPGFVGGLKGITGAIYTYHVSVIYLLGRPLSSLPRRDLMDT